MPHKEEEDAKKAAVELRCGFTLLEIMPLSKATERTPGRPTRIPGKGDDVISIVDDHPAGQAKSSRSHRI